MAANDNSRRREFYLLVSLLLLLLGSLQTWIEASGSQPHRQPASSREEFATQQRGALNITPEGSNSPAEQGLRAYVGDGAYEGYLGRLEGRQCWIIPVAGPNRYLYVSVNDDCLAGYTVHLNVTVTARATAKPGILQIDYDSYLYPWKSVGAEGKTTGEWKLFKFDLPDCSLTKRCNEADFRITSDQPFSVAEIRVTPMEQIAPPPEDTSRDWNLENIPRFSPDRCGFAFGGKWWGRGGMNREIFEQEMQKVKELGFGWVRQFAEWAEIEGEGKGQYKWEIQDFKISCAQKYGLKTLGMIGYCTMWAADAPDSVQDDRTKYPPKHLGDLRDYVHKVVSRYKNSVTYWEGWNEPNVRCFWRVPPSGRDPIEHYVQWQRTFYRAAKRANPDCVVLTGGFADGASLPRQLVSYYEKGLQGTFDVMNIHIYGADPRGRWMNQQLWSIIRVMRHFGDGDKPIWITETGWPVECDHPYGRSLEEQAEWAPWLWAVALSYPQVERVFFYELRDRDPSVGFGFYRSDFTPRPVVARWKEFLANLVRPNASQ